jgi:hypothetical protein
MLAVEVRRLERRIADLELVVAGVKADLECLEGTDSELFRDMLPRFPTALRLLGYVPAQERQAPDDGGQEAQEL